MELRVLNPVQRLGSDWLKAANNLVFTLGASIIFLQALGNGKLNAAIVTELKMQV